MSSLGRQDMSSFAKGDMSFLAREDMSSLARADMSSLAREDVSPLEREQMSSLAREHAVPFAVGPRGRHHMTWFPKKAILSCGVPCAFGPAQKWVGLPGLTISRRVPSGETKTEILKYY